MGLEGEERRGEEDEDPSRGGGAVRRRGDGAEGRRYTSAADSRYPTAIALIPTPAKMIATSKYLLVSIMCM